MDRANELEAEQLRKKKAEEIQKEVQKRNDQIIAQSVTNEPTPVKQGTSKTSTIQPKQKKGKRPGDPQKLEIEVKSIWGHPEHTR